MAPRMLGYDQVPIRPPTKERLMTFKEVAGLTYDEAIDLLLASFLIPSDGGSLARAGLRVRENREKEESSGNRKGHQAMPNGPIAVSVA